MAWRACGPVPGASHTGWASSTSPAGCSDTSEDATKGIRSHCRAGWWGAREMETSSDRSRQPLCHPRMSMEGAVLVLWLAPSL